jgi:hypothetical protein
MKLVMITLFGRVWGAWRMLYCYLFCVVGWVALVPMAVAANNFIPVRLPHGVQVEIPRNWEVLSKNQRITIESLVQVRGEQYGVFDASTDLNFGANYYDESGKTAALMNIIYYPEMNVSQADAQALDGNDVRELNKLIHEAMLQSGRINGFSVVSWNGTTNE